MNLKCPKCGHRLNTFRFPWEKNREKACCICDLPLDEIEIIKQKEFCELYNEDEKLSWWHPIKKFKLRGKVYDLMMELEELKKEDERGPDE